MRGTPYGKSNLCKFAFAISVPVRRYAIQYAARHGQVSTREIRREFTDYDLTTARDVLYVLVRHGILEKGRMMLDVQGRYTQQGYRLTDTALLGLKDMEEFVCSVKDRASDENFLRIGAVKDK